MQRQLLDQHADEPRTLDDTLDRAWIALAALPRRELTMLSEDLVRAHLDPDQRRDQPEE